MMSSASRRGISSAALISKPKHLESSLVFIAGLSVVFFEYGNYWSWHFWAKWALIVGIFSVVFSCVVARRTTIWFLPIFLTSLMSALNIGIWLPNRLTEFRDMVHPLDASLLPLVTQFALQKGALYAYLIVVVVGLAFVWLPKACAPGVRGLLAFLSYASAACTLTQVNLMSHQRGAFSGNTGMNGSLIAVTLPFWLDSMPGVRLRVVSVVVALAAILLTQTSVPIGVLAVVLVAYALSRYPLRLRASALVAVLVGALLAFGAIASRDSFLSSSGRFEVWGKLLPWFDVNNFWWTGTGLGTATTIIPYAQGQMHADRFGWFIFMHSEPLQILCEMGIPGLVAALAAFGWTACRAFRHPVLFASLMGIAAESLFNYPLRLPLSCVSAVLVVWLILLESRKVSDGKAAPRN